MYLLSFESDLNRLRAINDIILVCRDQIITVNQLKDKSIVLLILPVIGYKSGLVRKISDKISDFKA
jgi:hypothetical protein